MSIATAISNAQAKVAAAYTALQNKGATMPSTQNLANMPDTINSIQTGGGSLSIVLVEYLESNGNQWINTGLYGSISLDYEITAMVTSTSTEFHSILGDRYSSSQRRYTILGDVTSSSAGGYINCGNSNQVTAGVQYRPTVKTTYKKSGLNIYINGDSIGSLSNQSFTTPNTITLFGTRTNGSFSNNMVGRIYGCKFTNGDNTLLDLVPVRIGSFGYMYDKVSGELFGNAGTGSFTVGPDVS